VPVSHITKVKKKKRTQRSRKSIKRRRNKVHEVTFSVPQSAADLAHIPKKKEIFSSGHAVGKDTFNGTLFEVFRGVFPKELLDKLEKFIIANEDALVKFVKDCRGEHSVSFLGTWTPRGGKTANQLYLTPTTIKQAEVIQKLITEFKALWDRVSHIVSWKYPEQVKILQQVSEEFRLFGIFSLLILNFSCGNKYHRDLRDWKNGFCAVFPFGQWTGGDLVFPDIGATVKLEKGDLILFRSFSLVHGSEQYEGDRHSVVLCSHNTVINNSIKE